MYDVLVNPNDKTNNYKEKVKIMFINRYALYP